MEYNIPQDSATLALQIQTLTASVEELTKQNQEMRLQLQQEENRSPTKVWTNRNNDEDSDRRDDYRRPNSSNKANSNLLRDMRKEMDELRKAIREKTNQNLMRWSEGQTRPSLQKSWSVPCPQSFVYHNSNHLMV